MSPRKTSGVGSLLRIVVNDESESEGGRYTPSKVNDEKEIETACS
jgi:hypothetical protein